jgi:hypothetical protein
LRLPKKKKRAAMMARAAMAPMTIPAMAPPEMDDEEGVPVGVVDAAAEVADWDSAAVVVTAVEVGVAEVDEVDEVVFVEEVEGKMTLTDSGGMG